MCAISGFISYNDQVVDTGKLDKMLCKAVDRGRDSFGIFATDYNYELWDKKIGKYDKVKMEVLDLISTRPTVIVSNHRAEPTTEYVPDKKLSDVQPFQHAGFILAHNGTISNDKELAKEHNLEHLDGSIDSYVLTRVIEKLINEEKLVFDEIPQWIYKNVKGSYALAIYMNRQVWLINNYKPIYLNFQEEGIYFASLPEYLSFNGDHLAKESLYKLPPYSALKLVLNDLTPNSSLKPIKLISKPNNKAVVVCSGGLDSVTTLKVAIDKFGKDNVTLLHFQYNCNAEKKEVEAVRAISKKLGVELVLMPLDIFGNVITESPILNKEGQIQEYDKGVEFAYEWVPARNTVMMAHAIAYAEAKGFGYIYLGNNLEESGAYPDNEMEFINTLQKLIPNAVADGYNLRIEQPVGNLMKHEIVSLGLKVKAPLELTWSCYKDGEKHCGVCGPCRMRKVAFEMAGKKEVIEYEQ